MHSLPPPSLSLSLTHTNKLYTDWRQSRMFEGIKLCHISSRLKYKFCLNQIIACNNLIFVIQSMVYCESFSVLLYFCFKHPVDECLQSIYRTQGSRFHSLLQVQNFNTELCANRWKRKTKTWLRNNHSVHMRCSNFIRWCRNLATKKYICICRKPGDACGENIVI